MLTEPRGVLGPHLRPLGHAPIQLRIDERRDVDSVDDHVLQLTADLDVNHLDASQSVALEEGGTQLHAGEVDVPHGGVPEEHLGEGGTLKVHALESCSGQILFSKLGHGS